MTTCEPEETHADRAMDHQPTRDALNAWWAQRGSRPAPTPSVPASTPEYLPVGSTAVFHPAPHRGRPLQLLDGCVGTVRAMQRFDPEVRMLMFSDGVARLARIEELEGDVVTPEQLRALADRFEQSAPPPSMDQDPGSYVVNDAAHKMARFLRKMADESGEPTALSDSDQA